MTRGDFRNSLFSHLQTVYGHDKLTEVDCIFYGRTNRDDWEAAVMRTSTRQRGLLAVVRRLLCPGEVELRYHFFSRERAGSAGAAGSTAFLQSQPGLQSTIELTGAHVDHLAQIAPDGSVAVFIGNEALRSMP